MKRNALKPFLFICLGLIITTIAFASADIDTAIVESIEVTRVEHDEATVKTKITNDGGSPVTHCKFQFKYDGDTNWTPHGQSHYEVYACKWRYTNMNQGSKAFFRVIAVNGVGESKPLATEEPTTFK